MQFYDLFKDIIAQIPSRYAGLHAALNIILPFVLMACAFVTAFFGLKCIGWWNKTSFFLVGVGIASHALISEVNFYTLYFWLALGLSLALGVVCAFLSTYLARMDMVVSEFIIINAALPSFLQALGEVPADFVSLAVSLAVVFLTVKYKYLIILPTTAFSGSFLFWEILARHIVVPHEKLFALLMGCVAFAFQAYLSREQLKNTYEDVKMKAKKTEKGGEKLVRYVRRKVHTEGVEIQNIRVGGVKNVRDLGGLPVEGGRVKKHIFLRAGHLNKITEKGAAVLAAHGLKTVIDLRNTAEKEEKPDKPLDGVSYVALPIFDATIPGLSHESRQDIDHIPEMSRLYAAVMNGSSVLNLCGAVRYIVLAGESEFAMLYHCTEGKDRTGMVTALLLTLLGADREVILEDYLFTNRVNRKKAIGYWLLVRIFKNNKRAAHLVYNVFLAREEYLNEVFKWLDTVGEEKLLSDYLKITPGEREAFRKRVTE